MARENEGENGEPLIIQGTVRFANKYILGSKIGEGAYAIVWEARRYDTGESVAIKKIENAFECLKFAKYVLRELRILRHLRHENIISVRDVFITKSKDIFRDVFIASDLLESDLSTVLKSSQEVSNCHVQFFLYQILRGVKYLHSAGVIHRDIKPRNLLVNSNCDLKICDFGLSRVYYDMDFEILPLTNHVCTRWYRPPEVLCSRLDYGEKVDIWSIGCVLAEMLGRKALFQGQNTQSQLLLITRVLGNPTAVDLDRISTPETRVVYESFASMQFTSFASIYPHASAEALGILRRMLRLNPDKRPTASEALGDKYVHHLHSVDDEPSCPLLPRSEFEFERRKLTASVVREELFREVLYYHPDLPDSIEYLHENMPYSISSCSLLDPDKFDVWDDE